PAAYAAAANVCDWPVNTSTLSGSTSTLVTGTACTTIVTESEALPLVARTRTVPGATDCTCAVAPADVMAAIDVLDTDQSIVRPVRTFADASRSTAETVTLSPWMTLSAVAVSVMDATAAGVGDGSVPLSPQPAVTAR